MNTVKKMLFFFDEEDTGYTPSDIPQSEADALIALYNATDGPNWATNTGWGTDPVVNNWYGITVAGGHVQDIALNSNDLDGEWTAAMITPFSALQDLSASYNAALNCSFSPSDLPDTFRELALYSTASTMSGSISDFPASTTRIRAGGSASVAITGATSDIPSGMTHVNLENTSSVFSGAIADFPSPLRTFTIQGTASLITGGASVGAAAIRNINIADMGMSQAEVDAIFLHIYTYWASYTYATPTLDINGSNAAPSGTYQDGDPPTTGKEYAYEIENDPEVTGNPTWTLAFTA